MLFHDASSHQACELNVVSDALKKLHQGIVDQVSKTETHGFKTVPFHVGPEAPPRQPGPELG